MSTATVDSRTVLRVCLIVLSVVGAVAVVWLLRRPIAWLILALFVAVAMSGPVNRLSRHMRRGGAIALSYLGVLLVPLAILALIVPSIVQGVDDLAHEAPRYAQQLQDRIQKSKRLHELDVKYGVTEQIQSEAAKLPGKIGGAATTLKDLGVGIVNSAFAALTILILSVFLVSGGGRWVDQGLQSLPLHHRTRVRRALENSAGAIRNFVAGVLVQSAVAGVSTFVVLSILGVPFAAPLGVLMALLDAIPLVGATLGAVVIAVVTLFSDFPADTIVWVVWAVIYQQLENTVIQPRIQGRALNINPFVVIVSVLFGSTLFGIPGALLAVPAAATLQILGREYLAYRRDVKSGVVDPLLPG